MLILSGTMLISGSLGEILAIADNCKAVVSITMPSISGEIDFGRAGAPNYRVAIFIDQPADQFL